MPRPKSAEKPISIRMPEELTADIVASAERASGKSLGDWIKDAAEFKLKLAWAIQADWYVLRQIDPTSLRLHGPTLSAIVLQEFSRH
jgi:hypothetical protein